MSYKTVPPPVGSEVVLSFNALGYSNSSQSLPGCVRSRIQLHGLSVWCSRVLILLASCLILINSGCGFEGSAASANGLLASPSTIDFGSVPVGQASSSQVSLSNQGSHPVSVSQLSVAGQSFFVNGQNQLPVTIAPGEKYSFQLGFKPSGATSYAGQYTVMDSAARPVARGTIHGSGSNGGSSDSNAQLTVNLASLSFGSVAVGSAATQPVTLTSTGTEPVRITAAIISGTGFSVSGATLPATLNPKQTLTLTVQFKPTATGAAAGKLIIRSNSSNNSTAVVSLNGNGTGTAASANQLTVSPGTLSFGNVAVASTGTQTVTLTSTGTGPVQITAATISGTGFSVSGTSFPLTLNANQTATLTVQFKPTATGAEAGRLTISSNSSTNGTAVVNLSGTGTTATTQHEVDLTWDAPSDSPVTVTGYNVYRSTGGTSSYQLLNSSPETQREYVDSTVQSGTTYDYIVKSVDAAGGESTPTSALSLTIP